ncbi:MAG: hypothetical protein GC182_13605 [Rhodopseudomonas sp.]|nr:hypothetical protein [Rhodopseudomonas sp.]
MVEITNRKGLERWLQVKPREWTVVIAARVALRVVPMLATELGPWSGGARKAERDIFLPSFRGLAASWVEGTWPTLGVLVSAAVNTAANAANYAAGEAGAYAANAAAYAANADAGTHAAAAVADAAQAATAATAATAVGCAVNAAAYAATAATAANFAADTATNAATSIWLSLAFDATTLEGGVDFKTRPSDLAKQSLWPSGNMPGWAADNWLRLKSALLVLGDDWEVWTDWYEARLRGGPANEELELARVMIDDDIWDQGPKVVNAHIKELIAQYARLSRPALDPKSIRAELAEVVSPAPTLTPDNLLDAGSNAVFDAPDASLDLPNLPIRQRALIQTILDGLPAQAPKHLRSTLEKYDGELLVRGVQPILGLLNDMAAIVEAVIGDVNARREWLAAGIAVAFGKFLENHNLFAKHFPLNLERDALYARTPIDEDAATGPALAKPFEDVAKATASAHGAGLTTDDFVKIVASLSEFAKVTSTLPPAKSDQVSAKKRTVLTGIGFLERVYNILGATVTLAATSEGVQLLTAVTAALEALLRLVH